MINIDKKYLELLRTTHNGRELNDDRPKVVAELTNPIMNQSYRGYNSEKHHAEIDLIHNLPWSGFQYGTLVITKFPCYECTKNILDVLKPRLIITESPYKPSKWLDCQIESLLEIGKSETQLIIL